MTTSVADQRLAKAVAATLRWTSTDEWGNPATAGGAVTVTVTRYAGGAVLTGASATEDPVNPGFYTAAISATALASLDLLPATWSVGATAVATTQIEVCGGFYFSISDLRASSDTLGRTGENGFSNPDLAYFRDRAEREAEYICGRAFVPRFRAITLDGTDDFVIQVPDPDVRRVVSASVDGTALTGPQVAALKVIDRQINQPWGNIWAAGQGNVALVYEHGMDRPPPEIRGGAFRRCRAMAYADGPGDAGFPAQARSGTVDGTSVQLDTAGVLKTGDAEVDAVYDRWSLRSGTPKDVPLVPTSRQIDLNSQYLSLFHGGQR
jgi:hypothetical protein